MLAALRSTFKPTPTLNLEQVFSQHHKQVFNAAYRVTGSAQDAEDVLQTVFLRLVKRQQELDFAPGPGAYLHRAAINAALDLMRARSRSRAVPLDEIDDPQVEDPAQNPTRRQQDREIRRLLRQAILKLSPKSAEIFCLRYLEEQDNQDIARTLGMSQTAVAVILHRARHQLRNEMRAMLGGTR